MENNQVDKHIKTPLQSKAFVFRIKTTESPFTNLKTDNTFYSLDRARISSSALSSNRNSNSA